MARGKPGPLGILAGWLFILPAALGAVGAPHPVLLARAAGPVQQVEEMSGLDGIACLNSSTCYAVGTAGHLNPPSASNLTGALVQINDGVPQAAVQVPGTSRLTAIACASVALCYAVGYGAVPGSFFDTGVLVTVTNGQPSTPIPVGGTELLGGIACPAGDTCYAVGGPDIITIAAGAVTSRQEATGVGLNAIACTTRESCYAVGATGSFLDLTGVIVPITNGVAGDPQQITGTFDFNAIACITSGDCYADRR